MEHWIPGYIFAVCQKDSLKAFWSNCFYQFTAIKMMWNGWTNTCKGNWIWKKFSHSWPIVGSASANSLIFFFSRRVHLEKKPIFTAIFNTVNESDPIQQSSWSFSFLPFTLQIFKIFSFWFSRMVLGLLMIVTAGVRPVSTKFMSFY